jgi:nicotinamide-nucleotide amidase
MPENNRKQAFVPAGSLAIPNPVGTAPAFITELDGKPIICLPGVPRELKYLLIHEVLPWVRKRYRLGDQRVTYRVLKAAGLGESAVDRLIGDLMGEGKNPEVGLLASTGEIRIRITATADGEEQARGMIRPIEEEIRSRLGEKLFGQDDDTLESVVDSLLFQQDLTLALLETFSGGLVALRLLRVPSTQLVYGLVIPDREGLVQWLGKAHSGPEKDLARALARRLTVKSPADMGLAIVGFPEKSGRANAMKGCAAMSVRGIEKDFLWQMGGDLHTLQERGASIGLNSLRLCLLEQGI